MQIYNERKRTLSSKPWLQHIHSLLTKNTPGWWYTYPSEEYQSNGSSIPNIWKNKKCSKPPTSIQISYPIYSHTRGVVFASQAARPGSLKIFCVKRSDGLSSCSATQWRFMVSPMAQIDSNTVSYLSQWWHIPFITPRIKQFIDDYAQCCKNYTSQKKRFLNYPHYIPMIAEYTPIDSLIKFGM